MATYSKVLLSGSTNGKNIKIAATATAGTLIHTAVSGTSNLDEVWLWAVNTSAALVEITLEWGEATSPDGLVLIGMPPKAGLMQIVSGLLLQNSLEIRCFASAANVITINGFVNRITA
jgi:hypothetical protein